MIIAKNKVWNAVLTLSLSVAGAPLTAADSGSTSAPASATQSPSAPPSAGQAAAQTQTAENVLSTIHHVNQMEIEAGQLAEKNAQSADVKSLGRELKRDHQAADQKLQTVARKEGVDLTQPAVHTADQQQKMQKQMTSMERLRTLQGAEFDRAFLEAMSEGHRDTIASLDAARAQIGSKEVKNLIAEVLPTLKKHQRAANDLESKQG